MSILVDNQIKFSEMLAKLLTYIAASEYDCTMGECWRTEEQAALNAKKGVGIKNSLHCQRLAVDLNFFKEGELISTPVKVAEYWESIGGSWGGRFGDTPHFSLAYGGRK